MSSDNLSICLGIDNELFHFNPDKVHDLYAEEHVLFIEVVVDGAFIATYEFQYSSNEDLLIDLKAISRKITSKEASHVVANLVM